MWYVIKNKPIVFALNLLVYSMLVVMMGSCAHFSSLNEVNRSDYNQKENTYIAMQYDLVNLPKGEHKLYLRDSAGDLVELVVEDDKNPRDGVLFELAGNRTYQVEAISFGKRNFLLNKLTQKFFVKRDRTSYIGAMRFELKNDEVIFSYQSPVQLQESLKKMSDSWKLSLKELLNPYTGKTLKSALAPTRVELKYGRVKASFKNYIEAINPCYVKEWKTNPLVLGKLDFMVVEANGVLRVSNVGSEHSASEAFEQCVWNSVANTKITDRDFQIKLPGILYF
ncbi:MAG: hypothetical protein VX642_14475 [Bdellovibrionota bacterium]|nr:hypothetical protein [Bdellovibrionota bacterium]